MPDAQQNIQSDTMQSDAQNPQADRAQTAAAGNDIPENIGKLLLFDLLDIIEVGFVAVFLFLLSFAYLVQPVNVDGPSMMPTLYDTDRLLMEKVFLQPKNGRIVIIDDENAGHFSDDAETDVVDTDGMGIVLVKRVIATGGQEINIDFDTGAVFVDGAMLDEPYIAEPTKRNDGAFIYPLTVPEGYLFVMGDNRMHSTDSRSPSVALVPESEVLGVVFLRIGRNPDLCPRWTDHFDWLLGA